MVSATNEAEATAPHLDAAIAAATTEDPPVPIGGRYQLDLATPLGEGGICHVYGGRDLRTRRSVAVKTLRPEYRDDAATRARFRREARLLAFLAHPNVVRVFDFVEDQGATWVVLERIEGSSLRELLARRETLPPAEIAPLLDQAAAALDHLHGRGLVHLDVKPQNLLLTEEGRVKLIDFGLAQAAGTPQQPVGGRTFGTAAYLAPEQVCGEAVGAGTDVYALGCVVYELLTGTPPFSALPSPSPSPSAAGGAAPEPKEKMIRARLERPPLAPTRRRTDLALPAWVDEVVLAALARDPADRPASAAAFAQRFRRHVDADEPGEGATLAGPAPATIERPRPPAATGPARNVYAPLPEQGAAGRLYQAGGRAARRAEWVRRALWRGVAVLLIANLLLALALFAVQGEIPGLYEPALALRSGGAASVVTADLMVRDGPSLDAPVVGRLGFGERVELLAAPVAADGEQWWPIAREPGDTGPPGYVAGAWLEPARPATPLERVREIIGLD